MRRARRLSPSRRARCTGEGNEGRRADGCGGSPGDRAAIEADRAGTGEPSFRSLLGMVNRTGSVRRPARAFLLAPHGSSISASRHARARWRARSSRGPAFASFAGIWCEVVDSLEACLKAHRNLPEEEFVDRHHADTVSAAGLARRPPCLCGRGHQRPILYRHAAALISPVNNRAGAYRRRHYFSSGEME